MTLILKREVLAAEARKLIDNHSEWDSFHCLVTLHHDGHGGLRPGTYTAIDPAVSPEDYPGLIIQAAASQQAREPADPAYAYALQIEAFTLAVPATASAAEQARARQAMRTRTVHEQPDAMETAVAWLADIHGRAWTCIKRRSTGEVRESFHAPGDNSMQGQMVGALLTAAQVTGATAWGLAPHGGA